MSRPHLRPRFHVEVRANLEDVRAQVERQFASGGDRFAGHVVGDHAQLVIRRRQRNLWTPWLTFAFRQDDETTHVEGMFSPHPSTWTLYVAGYGMVVITMMALGFFGLSQWMAGLPATMLWSLPIGTVMLFGLYLSAFVGQSWSARDMEDMRRFVHESFEPSQLSVVD